MSRQVDFAPTQVLFRAVRRNFKYWENIDISKSDLENVRRLVILGFEKPITQIRALELVTKAYPIIERFGEISTWIKTLERALHKFRLDIPEASRLMNILGLLNWKLGEYETAKRYHESAISLSRGSKKFLAESQYGLAQSLWPLGKYSEAETNCEEALRYFEAQDELTRSTAAAQNLIGMIHFSQGKFKQAVGDFYRAYSNFRKAKDVVGIARSLNNRAMNKAQLGEIRQAIRFYYQAAKYFSLVDDDLGVCQVLTSLGILYCRTGRSTKAKEVLQQAIPADWEPPAAICHRGWLTLVQGYLYLSKGEPKNAAVLFDESRAYWGAVGNVRMQSIVESGLAEAIKTNSLT